MKKLNLLIGLSIGFMVFSCSSDNNDYNENQTPQDPIIGIWNFTRAVDFYNNMEEEFPANACSSQGQQVFDTNGNYSFTTYGQPDNDCVNEYYSTSGSWTNINDEYQVSYESECIGGDCNDETTPLVILIDANTLRIQYNGQIVNGELTEYYFREYNKE